MATTSDESSQTGVRVAEGTGRASASTGLPVLDHLLGLLAAHAAFDLTLEVAPGRAEDEVAAAGRALGAALHERLRAEGVRGIGSAVVPADEALAHVALEASGRPLGLGVLSCRMKSVPAHGASQCSATASGTSISPLIRKRWGARST